MVNGYLGALTTETRVLLHLNTHKHKHSDWSAPQALTQSGISDAVFIQRKHIPRTLNKLVGLNEVEIMKKHIPGGKQRRQIYILSEKGRTRAKEILNDLLRRECVKIGENGTLIWESNGRKPELMTVKFYGTDRVIETYLETLEPKVIGS